MLNIVFTSYHQGIAHIHDNSKGLQYLNQDNDNDAQIKYCVYRLSQKYCTQTQENPKGL